MDLVSLPVPSTRLWCQSKKHLMKYIISGSFTHLHLGLGCPIDIPWDSHIIIISSTATTRKKLRLFRFYLFYNIDMFAPKLDYLVVTTTTLLRTEKCDVTTREAKRCFLCRTNNIIRKLRCHNHSNINWILKRFCVIVGYMVDVGSSSSPRQRDNWLANKGNLYLSSWFLPERVHNDFRNVIQDS